MAVGDTPSPELAQEARSRPPLRVWMIIAILGPGLVVLALPTMNLIARNGEFFRGDFTSGRDLYALGLGLIGTGFAFWAVSWNAVGRYLLTCYLLLTPAWLAYSALGQWRRAVAGLLVSLLLLVVAWAIKRWDPTLRGTALFSALLVLSSVISTTMTVRSAASADSLDSGLASSTPTARPTTSRPNIYHIVMDEYQTEMFEYTLNEDVRQALSGFTFFPEARTTFGRTEMAMASIFGDSDYDYTTTPQDFVNESLRGPNSSFDTLRDAGYDISGFVHLLSLYGSPSPFDKTTLLRDYVDFDASVDYTRLANSLWVFANLPTSLAKIALSDSVIAQLRGDNLLPDDAPAVSALSFKTFIQRERELPDAGRYTLVHLVLPHFPYVMSADCEHSEGVESPPADQAACATSLMVELVEELRELDRFESSVILIHGDHGARFGVTADELIQLPDDVFSEEWSDARSRPLLLVKPAGVDARRALEVSEYPALLTDIMPTVFDSIEIPFVTLDGRISLLDDPLPNRPTRFYHFYNKGDDGLPDGELTRFVMDADGIRVDRVIKLPTE
jgi:hypothetical protein